MPALLRRAMVLVALLGATGLLAVNEWNLHRAKDSLQDNDDILAARIEIRRLQLFMLGAETAQRDYVITGQPDTAAQFRRLAQSLADQLLVLQKLADDSPERQAVLREVQALTDRRLEVMKGIVQLVDEGRPDSALALARSGLGNEHLAQLEALIARAAAVEQRRMVDNRSALLATLQVNRVAVAALLLLSMLAIALYLRHGAVQGRERARQAAELQAERDRLDSEVTRRTQDLREIAQHLQSAREDERSHLARELHDELGGLLTAAKLDVARLRNKLRDAPPEVGDRLAHLVGTLDTGIALKRRIIEDLRPSTLSSLGLQPALQILCGEFRQRSELDVQTDLAPLRLQPDSEITFYRVLQESLTNISKYAQARRVRISLRQVDDEAVLSIDDDGQGFDTRTVALHARGLAGMRFRLESCAGSLEVQSRPGQGTQVVARVPYLPPDSRPGLLLETETR